MPGVLPGVLRALGGACQELSLFGVLSDQDFHS